ncbi:hypothetical protein BACCOPRO_01502 [Phocaeicola coprophilus DSM 18228 = JCM 13818]|uniref:Uncharacterized protein n=1 Tax=Phocaeicola coprophilus DSM 18228 = JCM 13818 TaxID=547042 RepID=S0F6P6_9BACT|nr:hypothetical protein BACCOPRO_01502 [Phocaeicola coprophilus DSM 18228 = JCM 13818]
MHIYVYDILYFQFPFLLPFLFFGSFRLLKQYEPGFWLIPTDHMGSLPSSAGPGNLYSRTSYNTLVISTFVFSEVTASFWTNARSG